MGHCESELNILLKNENFIVVNKNYDLVVNSNVENRMSLQKQLKQSFPESCIKSLKFGFYFPHRLDFSTSGVMCVALNKAACAAASASFQKQETCKLYLALVRGLVSQPCIEINVPIGMKDKEGVAPQLMCGNGTHCRPAVTRMMVIERGIYAKYPATKVLLRPLTGRRHQLRVHCQLLGHSIVGDYSYSNGKDVLPPRMFLHSYSLNLRNRLEDLKVSTEDPFTEELVRDWTVVERWKQLENEATKILSNGSELNKFIVIRW